MYDYLVVGAGLYGAAFARKMKDAGKKVLVLEKRDAVAGNAYTEQVSGIHVHRYGAHVFHTNDKEVWDFVNQYAEFNGYINSPVANYKGEIFSLPFNMYTFHKMWGVVTPDEAVRYIEQQRSKEKSTEPQNLEEQAIALVGKDIYEKLVKGYTEKQWGKACTELPASIIKRIPLRFTFDNNYYDAVYQGIPKAGYTHLVEAVLKGIDVYTETDYLERKEYWNKKAKRIVYTGPIDAYFSYSLGNLEYRSLRFENDVLNCQNYQGNAVVNYTDIETPYTRCIEHKWFTFGKDENGKEIEGTVVTREYSCAWEPGAEPYYPVNDSRNMKLYSAYRELAQKEKNVLFGGRLGEYRYYDMDQTIRAALDTVQREYESCQV